MARTGKFGRSVRSVPSLTNTLVAIAREQAAREDQNVMDAWKNGGTFQGKAVTDAAVLAHWDQRLKGISKDDPLYDSYHDNVLQLQYGIAQSKMDLLHVQNKISDGRYAQFFLDWAKRVPKDSEFYRTLQKDAAQFMQTAAASGRGRASSGKTDAFNTYIAGETQRSLALADVLTGVMTKIAQDTGLIGRSEGLSQFRLKGDNDPGIMEAAIARFNELVKADPASYAGLTAQLKTLDPSWSGQLTSAYYVKALKAQGDGYQRIAARASADGYKSYVKWALTGQTKAHEGIIEAGSWPVAGTYSVLRQAFDLIANNPNSTSVDRADAARTFAAGLDQLSGTSGLDASMVFHLQNDALALRGDPRAVPGPSFYENYLGLHSTSLGTTSTGDTSAGGGVTSGENAKFGAEFVQSAAYEAFAAANPGAMVYGSTVPGSQPPTYDSTGKGRVGLVMTKSIDQGQQQVAIVPTTTVGGKALMLAVNQQPIYVDGPPGPDGQPQGKTLVGQAVVFQSGAQTLTLYKPTGWAAWTPISPKAPNIVETRAPDGSLHWTTPEVPRANPQSPKQLDDYLRSKYGLTTDVASHFQQGTPAEGETWGFKAPPDPGAHTGTNATVTWTDGRLVLSTVSEVYGAGRLGNGPVLSTDTIKPTPINFRADGKPFTFDPVQGAINPASVTDDKNHYLTLTMASLAAHTAAGEDLVDLWNSPTFRATLQAQELAAVGGDAVRYHTLAAQDARDAQSLVPPAYTQSTYDPIKDVVVHGTAVRSRSDLIYPTYQNAQGADQTPTITFRGAALKLPPTPGYSSGMNTNQSEDRPVPVAPGASLAPAPGYSPTPGPAPTSMSAPTPTPTPMPTPTPTSVVTLPPPPPGQTAAVPAPGTGPSTGRMGRFNS